MRLINSRNSGFMILGSTIVNHFSSNTFNIWNY